MLAQFFYADESLNAVACELDSFDGRQEPERCTTLVNQLRHCQDKVLTICSQIMDELIPESRANRDFRVKFPDDVMQENLAGQLWFGAECLAAGSSIMNREAESSAMRPLARALTKSLDIVRNLLREHALKGHMNLKVFIGRACSSVNNESHNPFTLASVIRLEFTYQALPSCVKLELAFLFLFDFFLILILIFNKTKQTFNLCTLLRRNEFLSI